VRLWRPKRGPVLTPGRVAHLGIGALVPCLASALGGYEALGWACAGMAVGACAWEAITPALGGWMRWTHRYGDVVDLLAFLIGLACGAGVGLAWG
jgi:hypothetical protein